MASNKRRKVEGLAVPKTLSAVAARKLKELEKKQGLQKSQDVSQESSGSRLPTDSQLFASGSILEGSESSRLLQKGHGLETSQKSRSFVNHGNVSDISPYGGEEEIEGEILVRNKSRGKEESLQEQPPLRLSTVRPENVKSGKAGLTAVRMLPGERLVVLGEYGLSVIRGQVSILGATLTASNTIHQVYAHSSHSLPVLRFLSSDNGEAEIRLHRLDSGLRGLSHLSPLFCKLWNDTSVDRRKKLSGSPKPSFQILFSTDDGPRRTFLQPIISAPEWNEALACSTSKPITMVCGPKSSGKSTFARLLANRLLTLSMPTKLAPDSAIQNQKVNNVVLLDLDPGQAEYSAPGQLSLIHLTKPNFGPPYTHPDALISDARVIRAHSIVATTPATDPAYYMACISDLLSHYRIFRASTANCSLIINTPGWVLGTGLEILIDLIKIAKPTEVIYMSTDGPWDVVKSLQEAVIGTPVLTLPSQTSEYTSRTAADLRTMQTMSYFHLIPDKAKSPFWNPTPLTSIPPWEVNYAGKDAGILGILCIGETPPPELLHETLNGSLVSIMVIEDKAAIEAQEDTNDTIIHTPVENLPYFNPLNATSLDPRFSHSVGMALIRGIDVAQQRLQLLSPIPASVLEEIRESDKSIVLVSGRLDTPGWAYTEELYRRAGLEKRRKGQEAVSAAGGSDDESEDGDVGVEEQSADLGPAEGFENVPWIERLQGDQGRGAGARVWKVRRDLGRTGDGG